MELLVAILNQDAHLEAVLAGFVELGITGATIVESRGMGRVLRQQLPLFAGLASLDGTTRARNHTIVCVLDTAKAEAAIRMVQEVCGDLTAPGVGIVFTVPVSRVVGLAPELER